jgi:hypothetical protein
VRLTVPIANPPGRTCPPLLLSSATERLPRMSLLGLASHSCEPSPQGTAPYLISPQTTRLGLSPLGYDGYHVRTPAVERSHQHGAPASPPVPEPLSNPDPSGWRLSCSMEAIPPSIIELRQPSPLTDPDSLLLIQSPGNPPTLQQSCPRKQRPRKSSRLPRPKYNTLLSLRELARQQIMRELKLGRCTT